MYEYYALPFPNETLETCKGLARYSEGIFERYYTLKGVWVEDIDLFGIYCGSPEADKISEEQALNIIKRLGGSL